MPLTEEEDDFLDRYLKRSERIPGPNPYATVLICATKDENRNVGPVEVLKRLWSAETNCEYDLFSAHGAPDNKVITLKDTRIYLGLDTFFLGGTDKLGYLQFKLCEADALVLAYDDTCRDSFQALEEFHEALREQYRASLDFQDAKSESHWHMLKRQVRRAREIWRRADPVSAEPGANEPRMDPGPLPKVVIANRCPDRPCVVPQEEGKQLAKQMGAEFFTISSGQLNWGDCDVLEQLTPRLVYRRACGIPKSNGLEGRFPQKVFE